jgi:hypothetical protein
MTNDDSVHLDDPAEQLKRIHKLLDFSTQRLPALDNSIQRFIAKFSEQQTALTRLHHETQRHQLVSTNIIGVRDHLTKVLDLLQTSTRLHPTIKGSIETNFDAYIKTMNEIKEAQARLQVLDFDDAKEEVQNLGGLQDAGNEQIVTYFHSLISEGADPLPESTFSLVGGEFVVTNGQLAADIYHPIPAETFRLLGQMARVVNASTMEIIQGDYAKTRASFLKKTLGPLFGKSRDRTMGQGPQDVLDVATYERWSHPVHLLAQTMRFLAMREKDILRRIFSDGHERVFLQCMDHTFTSFMKIVNKLRVPVLNSHVDLLFDLDLLRTLQTIMGDISLLCESTERAERSYVVEFLDLMQPLIDVTRSTLTTFADLVEKHDLAFVPTTGSVSPLTSNSVLFLIELAEYAPVLDGIPGYSLPVYSTTVITRLITNLQAKAKHYKDDVVIPSVFLMNNAHYAYTAIQSSPLAKFVAPSEMTNLEDMTQKAQERYLESTWATAVAKLKFDSKDGKEETMLKAAKLHKKQRMMIKHMFRDFCARIDEIMARHQGYNLKNQKLMASVYADAIKMVHGPYDRFWSRWKDKKFSKTPEKWISYQPPTLAEMISRLYGQDRKSAA